MNVPQINLLPWRDAFYARRRRSTVAGICLAVLAALCATWLVARPGQTQIADLRARGDLLRTQIAFLETQAKELEPSRQRVLQLSAWLVALDALQQRRIASAMLFGELAVRLPDAVYYTSWHQTADRVELRGAAESSALITALLYQLDASPWLHDAQLLVVEGVRDSSGNRSTFLIQIQQTTAADAGQG